MFEGLSKREVVCWVICLVFAVGLTLLGTAYLATSFMTADVVDVRTPYVPARPNPNP